MPNYVTPHGFQLLLYEHTALEAERAAVVGSEDERRRAQAVIDGRLALLNERIVTASLVEPAADHDVVRFCSMVTFTHEVGRMKGTTLTFTIVGVDEADVKQGRIALTAPLAKALMGRHAGEVATLQLGAEQQRLRMDSIG